MVLSDQVHSCYYSSKGKSLKCSELNSVQKKKLKCNKQIIVQTLQVNFTSSWQEVVNKAVEHCKENDLRCGKCHMTIT